ncbi:MAG: flagellar basal body protein [Candidatus Melainabacteria bacterium]
MTSASRAGWISASGMRDAQLRLDMAADNIVNMTTPGYTPGRIDSATLQGGGVASTSVSLETYPSVVPEYPYQEIFSQTDLVGDLLSLMTATRAYEANAKVFSADSHGWHAVRDILA